LLPPVLIRAMWWGFDHSQGVTEAANGWAGLFICVFLYLGTGLLTLSVIGCGIVALVRRERFWFLSLVGIVGLVMVWNWLK
jgi:hypothetical protein